MDEVFKEIRKRKALAEKLAAEENNGKEFRIYQRAYADALTFVLEESVGKREMLDRQRKNNAYLQIYPHKCFYGAFCFVLGDACNRFSKIRQLRIF